MKYLWFIAAFLLVNNSWAQSPSISDTLFLSSEFEYVEPDEAYYVRVSQKTQAGFVETTYFVASGRAQAVRVYEDASKKGYTGIWKTFYPDGTPKWEKHFEEASETFGLTKTWHENGQLKSCKITREGKNIDTWEGWYTNGAKKFSTLFNQEGEPVEEAKSWYANGAIATRWNYTGERFTVEGFNPDGSTRFKGQGHTEAGMILASAWDAKGEVLIHKGKGFWTWIDPDGTFLAEGGYKNGFPHGSWSFYHLGKEGKAEVQYKGKMVKGAPEGKWMVYDRSGGKLIEVDAPQIAPAIMPRLQHAGPHPMEVAPRPLNMNDVKTAIGYPKKARDAGIEGKVIVRVRVSEAGIVEKVRVIQEVHPMLFEAIESRLWDIRFTSAIQNGASIPFWVNIPFGFKLVD